jgi:hypothetical protein
VDAATYQHPGVGVVSVDRLTVEPALKSGSHPPALWWPAGGRPWRLEVPSEMGLVQEGLCSETALVARLQRCNLDCRQSLDTAEVVSIRRGLETRWPPLITNRSSRCGPTTETCTMRD